MEYWGAGCRDRGRCRMLVDDTQKDGGGGGNM